MNDYRGEVELRDMGIVAARPSIGADHGSEIAAGTVRARERKHTLR